jgi:hypothetical protein
MLLHRSAFLLNTVWLRAPRQVACICDRVFHAVALHARMRFASTRLRTVAYRSTYPSHFQPMFGIAPPPNAEDKVAAVDTALQWLHSAEGEAQCRERVRL